MKSHKYCPSCQSFSIERIHRGFVKKMMKSPLLYRCRGCEANFTSKDMSNNELKELSDFLPPKTKDQQKPH